MTASGPRVLALYGKGGVGKSTVATHLAVCYARQGKKVLLIGCDPKADSALRLVGDGVVPTLLEVLARDGSVDLDSILVSTPSGVDVVETGGPDPGKGCGGRAVASLCEILDRNRPRLESYDVLLFDILGDLVCGGFVSPLRLGFASTVLIVSSEETASLFAANNIARGIQQPYLDPLVLGGIVFNLRSSHLSAEVLQRFSEKLSTRVLHTFVRSREILVAEAQGSTAIDSAPGSAVSLQFDALSRRLFEMGKEPDPPVATPMDNASFRQFSREFLRFDVESILQENF